MKNSFVEELMCGDGAVSYEDYRSWIGLKRNREFLEKQYYRFLKQVTNSTKTLAEEIDKYTIDDLDFYEGTVEMCKYFISKKIIVINGDNSCIFNNKFEIHTSVYEPC